MKAEGLRCRICWAGGEGDPCARCRYVRPAFRAAGSVFVYDAEVLPAYRHDGAVRASVHALKYRGVSALAREMGGAMAAALEAWAPPVEAIVPVPLFGMRQRMRGYNQSALLAREVGRHAGLPVEGRAIVRRRQTPPQVHQPGYDERVANVEGAFAAGRRAPNGRPVLLVDDVMTTTATLNACARVLLDAGSGPVFALTYARED
jgi:ComF family protein